MRALPWLLVIVPLAAVVASTTACPGSAGSVDAGPPAPPSTTLSGVGPRTTSNQFATPLLVYGRGLEPGQRLRLGAPFGREIPLVVDDATHGHAIVPAGLPIAPETAEVKTTIVLVDAQGATRGNPLDMVIVNDTAFVDVVGLVATKDLSVAVTASTTTDELLFLDTASGKVDRVSVGDGPWAIAPASIDDKDVVVVAHRFAPELRVVDMKPDASGARAQRTLPGPAHAHALVVDGTTAYVGEHKTDTLQAIDLKTGAVAWRADLAPNPRGITVVKDKKGASRIAVGSLVSGETNLVSATDGAVSPGVAPRPGVQILGGHTEPYAKDVVGSRGIRALVSTGGMILVASNGPNVGPNKDEMGVTGTGGVGVIDPKTLTYTRHLAFNYGVPQALALDEARARLYVADVAEGLVHVVDTKLLLDKDEKKARTAWMGSVPLPIPQSFPLIRPVDDFGVDGLADLKSEMSRGAFVNGQSTVGDGPHKTRAGTEIHTGPSGLALSADGTTLLVLERFTGRVTRLDVSGDLPVVKDHFALFDPLVQSDRRLGQVLYFADLGRTGMSCDSCHLEGHSEGVFFTKTGMMRLWRSPTLRGVRDTPPYFNPPAHPTLEDTVAYVGSRNRFQNPRMSPPEIEKLALFTATYTTLPNPFRDDTGGIVDALDLGDGLVGHPKKGAKIFEARCAGCHPPPLYALDQDPATRTRFQKVGTPPALEIRVDQQDLSFQPRTPPSLVGAWDVWPMLLSATAGYRVARDGQWLEVGDRHPIRAVLERYSPSAHGDAMKLSPEARADLEAFVMSL